MLTPCFSLSNFNIFSLIFVILVTVSWCGPLWVNLVWDSLCFLVLNVCVLSQVRHVFSYYVSNVFSTSLSFSFPSGILIKQIFVPLLLSQRSLKLFSFLYFLHITDFHYSDFQLADSFFCISLLLIPTRIFHFSYCILHPW